MSENTLNEHLKTGLTSVCRAWAVTRGDGVVLGFTDHDCDFAFDEITFKAGTGLTAGTVLQSNGLAVDNTEVHGALSSNAIRAEDIDAGLYDGAEVTSWLVNWTAPDQRKILFRGFLGLITRKGSEFQAELRGPADLLSQNVGRVFQKPCSAVLGDARCKVDTALEVYSGSASIVELLSESRLVVVSELDYPEGWFERGVLEITSGEQSGMRISIKRDEIGPSGRLMTLSRSLAQLPTEGCTVRLTAGCDRRAETCRVKFANLVNFRGFPDLPGEDWLMRYPTSGQVHDGGSLR